MSFHCSTYFNPNTFLKVGEPQRLTRCTDDQNDLSSNSGRASRRILMQEAKMMDEFTKTLEKGDGEDTDIVDKEFSKEDKESETNGSQGQMAGDLIQ